MLFVKLYLPTNKHAKIESANDDFETDLTNIVEILVNFKNIYLTIKVMNNSNNEWSGKIDKLKKNTTPLPWKIFWKSKRLIIKPQHVLFVEFFLPIFQPTELNYLIDGYFKFITNLLVIKK